MATIQLSPLRRRFLIGCAATFLQLALHAQTEITATPSASGTVELITAAGLGSNVVSGDLGLRYNPHPNVSIEAELGGGGWSRELLTVAGRSLPTGIMDGRLSGKATQSLRLKFYSGREHTGAYGGIGVVQQGYRLQVDSRFERPREERPGYGATTGLGLLLNVLLNTGGPRYDKFTKVTEGTVRGLNLTGGYAFGFAGGQRLELGVNYTSRALGSETFTYGTPQGERELKLGDHFGNASFRLEARYVVPLFR